MNSSEPSNKIQSFYDDFYIKNNGAHYSKSLIDFLDTKVLSKLDVTEASVLDLGAGVFSVFEDSTFVKKNIVAIDFSKEAIGKKPKESLIQYEFFDISNDYLPPFLAGKKFDLVFDSHCVHCILDSGARKRAFENIHQLLRRGGIFSAEMMIQPAGKEISMPYKHIVSAYEIEKEILSYGFKLEYFMIVNNLKFYNENVECDIVRIIARK